MLCVLFERWYLSYAIFWSINHTMNGEMKNKLLDINSTIAFLYLILDNLNEIHVLKYFHDAAIEI